MSSTPIQDIPAHIAAVVARAVAASARPPGEEFLDVLDALSAASGVESVKSLRFRLCNHQVRVGRAEQLQVTTAALARVSPLSLSVAPKLVACLPAGADHAVLITRYAACPNERLLPVQTLAQPFRPAAVERLRQDMRALASQGLVHAFARGTEHWLVSSETGALALDDWYALREGTAREGAEMLDAIDWAVRTHQEALDRRSVAAPVQRVHAVFGCPRVLLPVIHPIGWEQGLASVRVAVDAGCKGIFLIDQGMSQREVLELVLRVRQQYPELWVGVNLLGLSPADALTAALGACHGRIDGLWSDDAGVDERASTQRRAEEFLEVRRARQWSGVYFGGVAFKDQREVASDLLGGAARRAAPFMDVICTSGPGTNLAAQVDKVRFMRAALGPDASLALASGVNAGNVGEYLPYVDAFLVGTGMESGSGVLDPRKVEALNALISKAQRS